MMNARDHLTTSAIAWLAVMNVRFGYSMVRAQLILKIGVFGLLASVGGYGCGSAVKLKESPPSLFQLNIIARAYAQATEELGHPPMNKAELMQAIKDIEDPAKPWPADILISPNDGEEFVIHWGFDIRTENVSGNPSKLPVLAYERHSTDGKRMVLQIREVRQVTDEQLAKLPFPQGYSFRP